MPETINQYEIQTVDSQDRENFFIIRAKDEGGAFNSLMELYPVFFKHLGITLTVEAVPQLDDMSVSEFNKQINKTVIMDFNKCLVDQLDELR